MITPIKTMENTNNIKEKIELIKLDLFEQYRTLASFTREEWKNLKNSYDIYTGLNENDEPISEWDYVDFGLNFDENKQMWRIDQIARTKKGNNTTEDTIESYYIDEWENNIPEEVLEEICFELEQEEVKNMHEISDYYEDCVLEFHQDPNNEGEELPEEIASLEKYFNFGKYSKKKIIKFIEGKPILFWRMVRTKNNIEEDLDLGFERSREKIEW